MTALQIAVTPVGDQWAYTCHGHTTRHAVDGLTRLCRCLVADGLSGPAEVRRDGVLWLTVSRIERLAKKTLREDSTGLHYHRYVPFDREWLKGVKQ